MEARRRDSEGARFGAYEIERRIGAGGMAETYVAVRRGPGGFEQRVCLKRILPALESDHDFVRLFLEEAKVSASLRHANIAQVVDFGVADGSHYLALELVEGLDLRALLAALRRRGETLPPRVVAYLAIELATALEFAHHADEDGRVAGVVHRDVSPSNVLVSRAGEVKLADFGIAKAASCSSSHTRTGVVKGKVPYMAPEYARFATFDARSDLYALGVTLFECLAGHRPYDGITDIDTIERSTAGRHTPLRELAPDASGVLVDAIERLIRPEPAGRHPSAARFLDDLAVEPPSPLARRAVGELIRRLERDARETAECETAAGGVRDGGAASATDPASAPVSAERLGFASTALATPSPAHGAAAPHSATHALGAYTARPRLPDRVASPYDPTRTRNETPAPVESTATVILDGQDASALGGAPGSTRSLSRPALEAAAPAPGDLAAVDAGTGRNAQEPTRGIALPITRGSRAAKWIVGAAALACVAFVLVAATSRNEAEQAGADERSIGAAHGNVTSVSTRPSPATSSRATSSRATSSPGSALGSPRNVLDGPWPSAPADVPPVVASPPPATARAAAVSVRREPVAPEPVAPEPVAPEPVAPGAANERSALAPAGTLANTSSSASGAESSPTASSEPSIVSGGVLPPPNVDAVATGTLHVVVVPFGEVWIDGTRVGSSPVRTELPVGEHVVTTGGGDGARRREIAVVRSGERTRVVLRARR